MGFTHFVVTLCLLTNTPQGWVTMPFQSYGNGIDAMTTCQIDAAIKNKTLVQRYKYICQRWPEIEI